MVGLTATSLNTLHVLAGSDVRRKGKSVVRPPSERTLSRKHQRLPALLIFVLVFGGLVAPAGSLSAQTAASARFTAALKWQEIEPGIEYGQTTSGFASNNELTGPWFINVIRVDLKRARLKIVRALDEGVGMETVSSLAARHQAPVATNGGYFRLTGPYRGESLGMLLRDRKLISEPYKERAEFGLIESGDGTDVIFGHLKFAGEIAFKSQKHSLAGVNRPLSPDELIVFTPEFHRTTLTNPDGIEVVVRNDKVTEISDRKGSCVIPSDGYVISAVGSARDWLKTSAKKGMRVNFSWQLNSLDPREDSIWRRAQSILGGGPQLIKAGKIEITDQQEKMSPTFATERHPRTAIAKLSSGQLLLVTVDGRQPGVSAGMTLQTLAELLLELGAVDGMNLDGGGSTTMVIHNQIVNKPSDQTGERPVSDAILVFPKRN